MRDLESHFDFLLLPDGTTPQDPSTDVAPSSEVGSGIPQESTAAADTTSAPNVSPASSVASDIPSDMPPDVTLGLDNNLPDASSSDVTQGTSTDVTTSSDNSTVIDIDQTVPATTDSTPKIYSTSTKVPSRPTSNLSEKDVDRVRMEEDDGIFWRGTVVTSNSTSSIKDNEQSSPQEITTIDELPQDEKKAIAMYKRHFKGKLF